MKKTTKEHKAALSGRLWKYLAGLTIPCLAVFLAVRYLPRSQEVSWAGTAVEYRLDDPDYAVNHEAVIEGTYTSSRAGKQAFDGTFWISDLGIDPDMRASFSSERQMYQFYDAAGQPVMTPVYAVARSADGRGAAVWLWDKYMVDEAGGVHASFAEGRRFLCVGEVSRQDAAGLLDTVKYK